MLFTVSEEEELITIGTAGGIVLAVVVVVVVVVVESVALLSVTTGDEEADDDDDDEDEDDVELLDVRDEVFVVRTEMFSERGLNPGLVGGDVIELNSGCVSKTTRIPSCEFFEKKKNQN